ncbi:hypothetical protein MMC34_007637 [Xylographa carneopallida]|nr:hypothetical protein [Xylographa carneopallida]
MDRAARWPEQLSVTSQDESLGTDNSTISSTNEDLLTRFRSLLLSRNGHYPPRTPYSSPQFAFSPEEVNNKKTGFWDPNIDAPKFKVDKIIAKLALLETERHAMVVKVYDQPVALLEGNFMEGHRRPPSLPDLHSKRRSGSDNTIMPMDTTVDQKTLGATLGRDLLNRTEAQTDTRKTAYGTRIPRYVLRTVNPSSAEKTEARLRPGPQHVPGSYRSEVEPVLSPKPSPASPSHMQQYFANRDEPLPTHDHTHTGLGRPMKAQDALHDIEDHLVSPLISTPHHPDTLGHSFRSLIPKASQSSFDSNTFVKRPQHPLLQPSAESMNVGNVAAPLLTSSFEDGHSRDADQLKIQEAATSKPSNILSTQLGLSALISKPNDSTRTEAEFPATRHRSTHDSDHIAELLAAIPPFCDDTDHSEAQPAEIAISRMPTEIQQKPGNYSPSVHSRRSSLRFKTNGKSRNSSFSPMQLADPVEPNYEQENANSARSSSKASSNGDTSSLGQKLSSFGRALTHLSELSLQPVRETASTESLLKHNMNDFENEATHLQKSPSLLSTEESTSTNEIRRSSVGTKKDDFIESKHHWVKELLGRRSSTSRSHMSLTNLTARPRYKQKFALQDSVLRGRANTLASSDELIVTGDGPRSNRRATDSTDAVFGQRSQQNADSFTKIIGELEGLLKEALNIAHQAAEKEETPKVSGHHELISSEPPSQGDNYHHHILGLNAMEKRQDMDRHVDASYRYFATPVPATEEQEKEPSPQRRAEHNIEDSSLMVKPGRLEHEPLTKTRHDTAPSNLPSPKQTRHASLAAGTETIFSTSEHAKLVADQLGVPVPGVKLGLPSFESSPRIQRRGSRESSGILPERMPFEVLADFGDRSTAIDNEHSSPRPFRPYPRATVQPPPQKPRTSKSLLKEQHIHVQRKPTIVEFPSTEDVQDFIGIHHEPPIQPRSSSARLRMKVVREESAYHPDVEELDSSEEDIAGDTYIADFRHPGQNTRGHTRQWTGSAPQQRPGLGPGSLPQQDTITSMRAPQSVENFSGSNQDHNQGTKGYSLRDRNHFSIRGPQGFSLSRSHRRAPIARDWSTRRKRFVATVTCINTALIGLIIGIYAGEVPAIQYAIVDENHYAILGNVVFFIGMAITTVLFFPLPLLHGRKPYTIAALGILLPLQFPQAVAVGQTASPYVATYRVGLLLSRSFAGILAGFVNMNLKTTLLDLFGASLQSGNPHQETVNENDVRRHGGGMGIWLGIWTWCSIGSIGIGFLIGAVIISGLPVTWGFWITIILTAAVLLLNVMTPEVRRSPYRRSMAEVHNGTDVSRRIARGEIKMHLYSTGPRRWWEEVIAGHVLCFRMLKQPGFLILSIYMGWIYGQVIMVIVLLGALTSKYYFFLPQYVGLCVAAIAFGALLAIPFQKASLFSRARHHAPRTDSMTFEKRVTWTSHLIRRAVFMILLPFAGLAYTLASGGPNTSFIVPTLFAAVIGFLSNLAIAECNGIIMETYDTSDLQPGMTGRPRRILPEDVRRKRTNFSCFPRVTAAFAINQTIAFLIAAAATGTGGRVERSLGAQAATGVVAGVLLVLTLLLIAALTRVKTVQIVPTQRYGTNVLGGPEDEWKPVIIGNPSGTTRRLSLLEMGAMTRWSEIRKRNKLLGA